MTQADALNLLKMGNNCFITGPAGSGKTYLLNEYIKWLNDNHIPVAVTASTGLAATHLNGVTIHSWSGLGARDSLTSSDLATLETKKYLWQNFSKTAVLIIDEISMLGIKQIEALDAIARLFKDPNQVFGGLQVVVAGDFFQLPPVGRSNQGLAYQACAWRDAEFKLCFLESQFRQDQDDLLNILTAIRDQTIGPRERELLLKQKDITLDHISPVRLFTHNFDVDTANEVELAKLAGRLVEHRADHHGNKHLAESLERNSLLMPSLKLKLKAKVMFIKNNYELGVANGTLGEVIGFGGYNYPQVRLNNGKVITVPPVSWTINDNGKILAEVKQIPLRLAWALTIHKSQGLTLEAAEIDLSRAFGPGMGYVALSRLKNLAGLKLLGFNDQALLVNDEVVWFEHLAKKEAQKLTLALKKIPQSQKQSLTKRVIDRFGVTKKSKITTYDKTADLIKSGLTLKDIAKERDLTVETIITHLEKLKSLGKLPSDIEYLKPAPNRFKTISLAFKQAKTDKLNPIKNKLPATFSFAEIRLGRLFLD